MIGLSYDWRVDKHNRHHRNPNHVELDPDVGTGTFASAAGGGDSRSHRSSGPPAGNVVSFSRCHPRNR